MTRISFTGHDITAPRHMQRHTLWSEGIEIHERGLYRDDRAPAATLHGRGLDQKKRDLAATLHERGLYRDDRAPAATNVSQAKGTPLDLLGLANYSSRSPSLFGTLLCANTKAQGHRHTSWSNGFVELLFMLSRSVWYLSISSVKEQSSAVRLLFLLCSIISSIKEQNTVVQTLFTLSRSIFENLIYQGESVSVCLHTNKQKDSDTDKDDDWQRQGQRQRQILKLRQTDTQPNRGLKCDDSFHSLEICPIRWSSTVLWAHCHGEDGEAEMERRRKRVCMYMCVSEHAHSSFVSR